MKLTTTTQISIDGVMQGPGGHDEDRRGAFDRGGWSMRHGDPEVGKYVVELYTRADAFLFGRWTYELFAGYWGTIDPAEHPLVAVLNERPKYVVSGTLSETRWINSTVLSGDLAAVIAALKAEPGGELQVHGSGTLVRWLLGNDLVDELNLLIKPVVVGEGVRLFPSDGREIPLELMESRAFPMGTMLQVYRPSSRDH